VEGDAVKLWRQMVLVIEKQILCGGCREEDSPITIGRRDLSGREGGMKESVSGWVMSHGETEGKRAVQFEERTERADRRLCLSPTVWRLRQGHPGQCMRFSKTGRKDDAEIQSVNGEWL
jgi:hypothetical protein